MLRLFVFRGRLIVVDGLFGGLRLENQCHNVTQRFRVHRLEFSGGLLARVHLQSPKSPKTPKAFTTQLSALAQVVIYFLVAFWKAYQYSNSVKFWASRHHSKFLRASGLGLRV